MTKISNKFFLKNVVLHTGRKNIAISQFSNTSQYSQITIEDSDGVIQLHNPGKPSNEPRHDSIV